MLFLFFVFLFFYQLDDNSKNMVGLHQEILKDSIQRCENYIKTLENLGGLFMYYIRNVYRQADRRTD